MDHMKKRACQLIGERGVSMVEYSTIAALIVIACLFAVQFLGLQADSTFRIAGESMEGGGTVGTSMAAAPTPPRVMGQPETFPTPEDPESAE